MLPRGRRYLDNKIQFVHVDDVARLVTRILEKKEPESQRLTVLNVAGRGEPLTFERCIEVAQAKLVRLPGKLAFRTALKILWQLGIVAIPPEAAPYMTATSRERPISPGRISAFQFSGFPLLTGLLSWCTLRRPADSKIFQLLAALHRSSQPPRLQTAPSPSLGWIFRVAVPGSHCAPGTTSSSWTSTAPSASVPLKL